MPLLPPTWQTKGMAIPFLAGSLPEALDTIAMGERGSIEMEKPVQLFIQPDGLSD
jgi:hypothetical protein